MRGPRKHELQHHLPPEEKSGDEITTDHAQNVEVPFFAAGGEGRTAAPRSSRDSKQTFAIEIRRAVVIDDDLGVLNAFERMLSSLPCLVHCASDVHGGNELVRLFQPDLALVDVMLDRNDKHTGLAAISSLRQLAPELVIGAISGAMNDSLAAECIEAGADWVLAKPVRKAALLEAVCTGRHPVPMMLRTDLPLDTIKELYIERVMAEHNGNKSAVARALGKRRTTVQRMTRRKDR